MIDLGFEAFDARRARVESAARTIVALCREDRFGVGWRPKGVDEVAILLESLGYSSEVVQELWYDSLFDLAADVMAAIDQFVDDEERAASRSVDWFRTACRDYAIGALYSGPWVIAVAGLAVFGSALWSSLSMPTHLATAIALGVYAGLIVAGAFSQSTARRLTFYFLQDNARMMAWTIDRFAVLALVTFALLGLLGWLALRSWYGDADALLAAAFFAGSGIFQVALAPLYTIRRFGWIIGISAFGTLVTGLTFSAGFHRVVTLPSEPATIAAEIGLIGLVVLAVTVGWARRRIPRDGETSRPMAPAAAAVAGSIAPYALYGACYFVIIVADRIAAGLTAGWPFTYRAGYELGCDVALLAIVPIIGIVNVAMESLPRRILAGAGLRVADQGAFDGSMVRFYLRAALGVALAAALVVVAGDLLATFVLDRTILGRAGVEGDEARFVARWASAAYGILMLGLLNCQLLFFLSRPAPAVAASVAGALVCIGGLVVERSLQLPAASSAFALAGGCLTFSVWTTAAVVSVMRRFTYAYYAAY